MLANGVQPQYSRCALPAVVRTPSDDTAPQPDSHEATAVVLHYHSDRLVARLSARMLRITSNDDDRPPRPFADQQLDLRHHSLNLLSPKATMVDTNRTITSPPLPPPPTTATALHTTNTDGTRLLRTPTHKHLRRLLSLALRS